MERDQEGEVTFHGIETMYGYRKGVSLPADAGAITGICRTNTLLLITTDTGRLFTWDEKPNILDEIKLPA